MHNGTLHNAELHNGPTASLAAALPAETTGNLSGYVLEVHDASGDLLGYLREWWGGHWQSSRNEPGALRVIVHADNDLADDLVRPNQVWLRALPTTIGDTRPLLGKFRILKQSSTRGAERVRIAVQAEGILGQLGDELVIDYTASSQTVKQIARDLLRLQEQDNPIFMGRFYGNVGLQTRDFRADGVSVLGALQNLWKSVGGYFYVSPTTRKFHWVWVGDDPGKQIRYRKNMKAITRTEDASNLITRVYMYGGGLDPDVQLNLVDAGEAHEYIDSSAVATYGIIPRKVTDRRITQSETLLRHARQVLAQNDRPRVTYDLDVANLAASGNADYAFEDFGIGDRVRVIDEGLDISEVCEVQAIDRDLDNPLNIRVELAEDPELVNYGSDDYQRTPPDTESDLVDHLAGALSRIDDWDKTDLQLAKSVNDGVGQDYTDAKYTTVGHRLVGTDLADLDEQITPTDADVAIAAPDGTLMVTTAPEGAYVEINDARTELVLRQDQASNNVADGYGALSDATPEAVAAAGAAGSGTKASRDDHVHEGGALSDATPAAVADTGAAGTGAKASRDDHVHEGLTAWVAYGGA